jgi:LysR family hca operon transcriptional activator
LQVDAAGAAARRASAPPKASFVLGFLTGQEMMWLPEAMRASGAGCADAVTRWRL